MDHTDMNGDRYTTPDAPRLSSDGDEPIQYPESAVAVVGVACRFSGADSLEELWQILETGTSQSTELPKDRFPDFRFERRPYKRDFRASLMNDVDAFDHKFFNVPSREASFRDPQQRLALEVTYQALESAGYFSREITEEQRDMGCYIATATNEYLENVVTHAPSAFSLTGPIRPFVAGQISHHFGFTGPAVMVDAACAASGAAINIACRAVASGECKTAIAGAAGVFVSPNTFQDLACGSFTNATGPSRPFDTDAAGYGRGEGVAAIVLKRLSDAQKDGDVIKCVISSTAMNQCANETTITVPHGPTQSSLYRKALRLANLDPSQIGYVEAHGTGTRVGDPIEAESIRAVYGDLNRGPVARTYMGSLKSNIGHTEATSGLSGLIKVMLMIEKGIIPQQALFNSLHPEIAPLEPYGLGIATKNIPWTSRYKAGCVNNYGASGSNAAIIVTQPPSLTRAEPPSPINTYPISITAFSQTSLESYCSALSQFIDKSNVNDDSLALDVAFHLSRRRNPELPYSVSTTISDLRGLKTFLASVDSRTTQKLEYSKRPTVLFFGGQDGKPTSVSRALYDSCAVFRKHLDDCDASLRELGHSSMIPSLFEPIASEKSVLAHSKLFSVQYATAKAWIDCGLQPSRLIGHSFGQLTALCVSGALSLQDALRLVTSRAGLIDELWGSDSGSMIAIEATHEQLSELLKCHSELSLDVACYNGARSFVLAGPTSSINSMEAVLKASPKALRFKRLQVPNAFHSVLAEPLVAPLQDVAESLSLQEPKIPLETCTEYSTWPSIEPVSVAAQIREPVHFHQAVQRIANDLGPCVWIEAGSGSNASLLRRALEPQASAHDVKSIRMDSSSSLESLAAFTSDLWRMNLKIQFWPFHPDQRHQYRTLNLPPYQFDKTRHWLEWQDTGAQPVEDAPLSLEPKPFIRLVRETPRGCEFEINTQFESWRKSGAENRLLGVSACSISLLLDVLSEAIGTIQEGPSQKAEIYRVQHLKWLAPIPVEMDNRLSLEVSRAELPQAWTFRMTDASNSHHEFASGTVVTGKAKSHKDFARFERLIDIARIKDIENDRQSDRVRGRAVYKVAADLFQIPKTSQVIQDVSASGNEATASISSLSESPQVALESLMQIPLICLNGIHECPDDNMFIHTGLGDAHFRTLSTSSTDMSASHSVYVKFFELNGSEPTCDMYVFDAQTGRISATILDVSFARVPVTSLRQSLNSVATALLPPVPSFELDSPDVAEPEEEYLPTPRHEDPDPYLHVKESMQSDGRPDLTQALLDLLVRVADLDADKLHEDTQIADVGVDSLMWMEVAYEINKFFAIDIDASHFLAAEDVRSLCELIAPQATGYAYNSSDASSVSFRSQAASSAPTTLSSNTQFSTTSRRPGPPISSSAFKVFDDVRMQFDALAKETGCDKFWSEIHPVQTRLIEAYILEAFAKLGCDLRALNAGDRIPSIPHKQGSDKLLKQLMLVLRDTGLVTQSGGNWLRTAKATPTQSSSTELFETIQAKFPNWAAEHELLHVAGSNLAGHFDGTRNPIQLLFGSPEARKLMADQYLVAPIQSTISRQLGSLIEKCFSSQRPNEPFRVLEIGGGTCGTTIYALDAFAKAGIPVEYTFTDISPTFISAAKSKLKNYKFVKYQTLDVTKVPSAEDQGQYDMIIATNVIHATPNATKSAGNVRQMLREGGFFALVEYTHIYAAIDVIFGQLEGWWAFDDGRTHAIMSEVEWKAKLECAGFDKVICTGTGTQESEIMRIFLAC